MLLIPARVDVPQDRYPVVNWLIIAVAIAVFVLQMLSVWERGQQVSDMMARYQNVPVEEVAREFGVKDEELKKIEQAAEKAPLGAEDTSSVMRYRPDPLKFREMLVKRIILERYYVWGQIKPYILSGFDLKGLFGHMWLHGGILHLVGNMLFLWIFGNAVCAKIGNLRYIPAYIGLGLVAGISQLVFVGGSSLGASGAINGIVGMFLVFFPQNEITCYFIYVLLLTPYVREFSVSSVWMILLWLVFDILGVILGGGGVAYFAHLGGFTGGVILAILMLKFKMVTMERHEKSLLQVIEEYRHPPAVEESPAGYYGYLNATADPQQELPVAPLPPIPFEPKTISSFAPAGQPEKMPLEPQKPKDEFIRFACSCGKRVKMPAKYAGKTGKCPQCNARLKIPEK